ncbi:pleckstrin homology domain-containing family G member 5 isoform X2 [Hermetia illucens]|uniref:pleckstrin homology domain-containing family G member 5 isoform X2 n=1 Tax=Hermetia illucens TaxID=343691 RepID=UPI0018CC764A|nr:pleckstrin homology domain-containing family G member 5 isoform X2 [Hermetia illucens]
MNKNNINNNNNKTPNKNVSGKAPAAGAKVPKVKRKTKPKSETIGNDKNSSKQTGKNLNDVQNNGNLIIPTNIDDNRLDMKKIGRSNSFSLTRRLSKLITTITGSRENINEIKEDKTSPSVPQTPELPFKFTRSRSMITLRKSTRRSVLEPPQLEKLAEEAEHSKSPTESTTLKPPQSPGLFESLKRTFSNSSEKRRSLVNPRWSASLQNLQEIDNMVSYEDLSFVNYDKFNEYEKHLERQLSQHDLSNISPEMPPPPSSVVVRRRKKPEPVRKLGCANLINVEGNFDQRKNLFRQSIDEEKLQHINDVQRNSFRWSQGDEADGILFRYGSRGSIRSSRIETIQEPAVDEEFRDVKKRRKTVSCGDFRRKEEKDEFGSVKKLKSKSLTDLDILDSISCQRSTTIDPQKQQRSEHKDSTTISTATATPTIPPTTSSYHHQHPQHSVKQTIASINANSSSCNKICCLGSLSAPTAAVASQTVSSINCNLITSPTSSQNQSNFHPKKKSSFMQRKKPLLSRSQVSSSEYFSVSFCTNSDRQDEELIPAIKGTTLLEALNPALKKRNLSFSQIAICDNSFHCYTEPTSSPPYTSSLDESTDVESLAGKHLIIVDRDGSKRTGQLQKAASFGARTRPPRLLSSASTEETTESEQKIVPGKQLKQRWSGLFGMKNNQQQNQLCQLLDDYDRRGVPQKIHSMSFQQPEFQNALNFLDKYQTMSKSWRDFVHCDDMSDSDVKIQSAIWELVTTEIDYINVLKTVTDLFLACLEGIQDNNLLTDVDQHKLFSNIYDIYEANVQFWSHYLHPMVENSMGTGCPLSIDYFQEGFINFAINFAPYKKYCAEQSTCQFYCKELNRNNPLFTYYLTWCEAQKMCNRLRLADILVRPMQRLTKYSLLLLAIRKHITDENDGDNMDAMIHSVENFVCSVNTHLTTRQENERLKGIMARIESYDVVDSNNEHLDKITKQYSTMFDLCSPMKGVIGVAQGRHLFMEGDLKFKDNLGKSDVHCFLLTDILLVCKTIAKKGQGTLKVIRQPFLTDRLIVKHKDNILYCVYLNEFQIAVAAFTLQCTEAKSWYEAMNKAKHIYSRLKQGSNWEGYNLRHTNSGSFNNADTLSIKKSPINSSIGSRVSSLNNSHSGSVELNDSRNVSIDFEKTNSLSSDEGSFMSCNQSSATKPKTLLASPQKLKTTSSNQLAVQPHNNLGQSLPNLNIHPSQTSNNTLLVPGSSHSGYLLLSPSHRGISYPPPSPTRATLRRGFAFSSSIKNPPLVKTRNITSQNSFAFPIASAGGAAQTQSQQTQSQQQQQIPSPSVQQQQQHQQLQPQSPSSNSLTISNESNV